MSEVIAPIATPTRKKITSTLRKKELLADRTSRGSRKSKKTMVNGFNSIFGR